MKIVQLVKVPNKNLHESIAKNIPRGISSQQQILNVGYKVAVQNLGLQEAKKLNEQFAIKLLASYYRQHLDEGLGTMIGKGVGGLAKGLGAVAGGIHGMWNAAKKGYAAGKAVVSGDDEETSSSSGGGAGGGASGGGTSGGGGGGASGGATGGETPAPAPTTNPELDALMKEIEGLDDATKAELLKQLGSEGTAPAPSPTPAPAPAPAPGGQSMEIDPAKAAADKQAKNAADAAERDKQIAATKQANAQSSAADNALVAAVKAAKAKPAFQQTASDKLTIKQGAAKGIHESKKKKKKKVVAEFNSKFLGMKI